jgi:hypothetical protein
MFMSLGIVDARRGTAAVRVEEELGSDLGERGKREITAALMRVRGRRAARKSSTAAVAGLTRVLQEERQTKAQTAAIDG